MANIVLRQRLYKFGKLYEMARCILYNSGFFYFSFMDIKYSFRKRLRSFKDTKKDKRCFIIGNGPSLRPEDLDLLENEVCFASNEIHKIFNRTKWRPTYYLIADRYSKTTPQQLKELECEMVFLGDYYCRFNRVLRDDYIMFHQHLGINGNHYRVSKDISKKVTNAPTVSFMAMQIAAYMGYKEIYIIGFDHSYKNECVRGEIKSNQETNSHFYVDDKPSDIVANLNGMEIAYDSFKKYADENGILIFNCSRKTNLNVFPKIDFDKLQIR